MEKIQNHLYRILKKEGVSCCYTQLAYCCDNCGKKTKEYGYLFNSVKHNNLICSHCEYNTPVYLLRCSFKMKISQEMRNYIHNTAEAFSPSFKAHINALKKIAIKN